MSKDLIVAYTNILYKHGVDSRQAVAYKSKHNDDALFQTRARKLDSLFVMKTDLPDFS